MSRQRFKMFTPERISIILLVTALCAWAAVTHCRRVPDDVAITLPVVPYADSAIFVRIDSTVFVGKKENEKPKHKNKGKKSKTTPHKKAVKRRDHLNEPVPTY